MQVRIVTGFGCAWIASPSQRVTCVTPGGADDATSIATIRTAIESGINLIDTAPVYGFGHSEEIVGKALEGMRDRAVIATKVALEWSEGKVRRNATATRI